MKQNAVFFLAAVVSILLYGCTTWTYGEKAWRQLHKNAVINIEQVMGAAPHKAPAVRPPTTYRENYRYRRRLDVPMV